MKNIATSEAICIGIEPLQRNLNPKQEDAFGRSKRSSHQENKVVDETMMGKLLCKLPDGTEFSIGTGFTEAMRRSYMQKPPIGQLITFEHLDFGALNKPRMPSFKGIRSRTDM